MKEIRFADDRDPKTIHHEFEKAIIAGLDAKSIRLDVLFEDDMARYDIELQVEGSREIPKRSRYYQAVMAVDDLKKGRRCTYIWNEKMSQKTILSSKGSMRLYRKPIRTGRCDPL